MMHWLPKLFCSATNHWKSCHIGISLPAFWPYGNKIAQVNLIRLCHCSTVEGVGHSVGQSKAGLWVGGQHTFAPAGQKMSIDGRWVCSIADILCTPAEKHGYLTCHFLKHTKTE